MRQFFGTLITLISINLFAQTTITVAEGSFKLSGISDQYFYYGFAAGDQLTLVLTEEKGKEIREIEIIEFPDVSRFIEFKSSKINKTIEISSTGIYKFRISNGAISSRMCRYQIFRTPRSHETHDFNTSVYWQTHQDTVWQEVVERYLFRDEYVPQVIVPPSDFYINSGSNADFKGGKSRILVPVYIPKNTVKWYYSFSAFREAEEVAKLQKTFSLVGQLTGLIDQSGTLQFGVELFTQPPGANYCDIYLLDYNNSMLFIQKQAFKFFSIGSRENLKSGISDIVGGSEGLLYLGLKNPDYQNGIHVTIEVVAIVHEQEYADRSITIPKVNTYKTPYLNN